MSNTKKIKDIMIDVFEYTHIPYWFTIKQAIGIVKKSLIGNDKCIRPMVVLVFDEKYNLVGSLTLKEILRGLEPKFLKPTTKAQVHEQDESGLSVLWDTIFNKETKESAERPVSEVIVPAKFFADPEDPITKAAYLMLHHDLVILPVLENKKKFVGVIRMIEIFDEISDAILK